MKITLKLFGTLDRHLPPGARGSACDLEVADGALAHDVLARLGVPVNEPGAVVVLVNGRHCPPAYALQEGDALSAFPAIAGG
ncbi:MAG TPA: MoaD/ThiS family protein [Anaerolineae bacterium]|nr:MoaD/ThiS family protein [Anaerolineae bacterium]